MHDESENFKKNSHIKFNTANAIRGIEEFKEDLQYHYFAQVVVTNCMVTENSIDMIMDIKCPISLVDMLGHLKKGTWGTSESASRSPLFKSLETLNRLNISFVDIEELNLFLLDTCIVFKKIKENSIASQFNLVLSEIGKHYIYFTKGLTEKPYEIFLPVIEDPSNNLEEMHTIQSNMTAPTSYFEHWGIYFESQDDALVYDVQNHIFISEGLDLCLQDND